ncbi:MAG: STAS domain-containing protein [bacterium]
MIQLEENQRGEYNLVTLKGEGPLDDIEALEQHFKTILARNPSEIILDLGHMETLPVHFAVLLFRLGKILLPAQGKLQIYNMPSSFRFILETARLDSYFTFHSSLDFIQESSSQPPSEKEPPSPTKPVLYHVFHTEERKA